MNRSGIYKLANIVNGKVYVGSAVNLGKRKEHHYACLRHNKHKNERLQRSWNKHSEKSFEFSILEYVEDKNNLIEREQYWMDFYDVAGDDGYNISPKAGSSLGVKHTAETRKRMSEVNMGKKLSPEHRKKISDGNKGRVFSADTRQKMSDAQKGRSMSPSHYANYLASRLTMNYVPSPATRKKLSESGKIGWITRKLNLSKSLGELSCT